MDRKCFLRGFSVIVSIGLLGVVAVQAADAGRPDSVSDDHQRPQILVLDAKRSLPGPIQVPRPIEISPVGEPSGYFGGGSGWNGTSAVPLGGSTGSGPSRTARIEAVLKKAAAQLR